MTTSPSSSHSPPPMLVTRTPPRQDLKALTAWFSRMSLVTTKSVRNPASSVIDAAVNVLPDRVGISRMPRRDLAAAALARFW